MDRLEALPILERICAHWGQRFSQSQHDHWMDTLSALDAGAAGTTYVRLTKKADRVPTPAEFIAEYRTVHVFDASNRRPPCAVCGDSGIVTDTDHPRHWPGDPKSMPRPTHGGQEYCNCNVANYCRQCPAGEQARETLRRIDQQRPHHDHDAWSAA